MDPKIRQSAALRSLVCLLIWSGASIPLVAQTVNVTIQGRVYDSTGAAIPQAAVSVVNTANGFSRSTTATSTGDYQIASLPVGDYTVTADKQGFQKSVKKIHLEHRRRGQCGLYSGGRSGLAGSIGSRCRRSG